MNNTAGLMTQEDTKLSQNFGYRSNNPNNQSGKLRINSEASYTFTKAPSLNKTVVVNSQPQRTVTSGLSKNEPNKKLLGVEEESRK
jgi:hypothetical protein